VFNLYQVAKDHNTKSCQSVRRCIEISQWLMLILIQNIHSKRKNHLEPFFFTCFANIHSEQILHLQEIYIVSLLRFHE
jgi:hypothetical protein